MKAKGALFLLPIAFSTFSQPVAGVESHVPVSLVQVLANPKPLKNETIGVFGYLGDDLRLYLTADHERAGDTASSILVTSEIRYKHGASPCANAFVSVIGKLVEAEPNFYLLTDISQVYMETAGKFCYKRKSP